MNLFEVAAAEASKKDNSEIEKLKKEIQHWKNLFYNAVNLGQLDEQWEDKELSIVDIANWGNPFSKIDLEIAYKQGAKDIVKVISEMVEQKSYDRSDNDYYSVDVIDMKDLYKILETVIR